MMRDFLNAWEAHALLKQLAKQATGRTGTLKDIRDYAMILLMLTCGLRISEVSWLDEKDLYKSSGIFCLLVHSKGQDGNSDTVNVPDNVAAVVLRWLELQSPDGTELPMFMSLGPNNTGGRLCPRTISQIVKRALRNAGFDSPRLTAHSLRHSAVTLALLGGSDFTGSTVVCPA